MKVRLTTERVERAVLAQGERTAFLWDSELRGFGLFVRARSQGPPSRTYVIRYGTGKRGQGKRRPIGQHGQPWKPDPETGESRVLTLKLAREEAVWRLGQRLLGKDPGTAGQSTHQVLTLAAFASIYLEDWSEVEKASSSVEKDRANLELHILPHLGRQRLDLIDSSDIASLKKSLRAKPVTFNRCLSLLHHLFRVARRWRKRSGLEAGHPNPCEDVTRYEEVERQRPLMPAELARVGQALVALVAVAATKKSDRPKGVDAVYPVAAAAIRALMATGARPSELLGVKRAELPAAIAAGMIVRPSKKVGRRRRRQRPVYLNPVANEILRTAPSRNGNPYVFPGRVKGHHLTISAVDEAWERVRKVAGIEDVRLYDVSRHAFGTMAALLATNPQAVQDLLGHSDFRTTQRYIHRPDAPLLELSKRTADALDQAMKAEDPKE